MIFLTTSAAHCWKCPLQSLCWGRSVLTTLRTKCSLLLWDVLCIITSWARCLMLSCNTQCILNQEFRMLFVFVYWFCTHWCKEISAGQWQVSRGTRGQRGQALCRGISFCWGSSLREWLIPLAAEAFAFQESMVCHGLHVHLSAFRCQSWSCHQNILSAARSWKPSSIST